MKNFSQLQLISAKILSVCRVRKCTKLRLEIMGFFMFLLISPTVGLGQTNTELSGVGYSGTVSIPYSGAHTAGKVTSAAIIPVFDATLSNFLFAADFQSAAYEACRIWSEILPGNQIPIYVEFHVDFTLPYGAGGVALASTSPVKQVISSNGPGYGAINFSSIDPKFNANTYYVWSLANKLANTDLNGSSHEITILVNYYALTGVKGQTSDRFYFGTDANCPSDQWDLVTTMMHEIGHGLGIWPSVDKDQTNNIVWAYVGNSLGALFPTSYDKFIVNSSGAHLTSQSKFGSNLVSFLQGNDLSWSGLNAKTANGNVNPIVFAPSSFILGSSISHLGSNYVGHELFYFNLGQGVAIHTPSAIGIGMLNDIGWDASPATAIEDNITWSTSTGGTPTYVAPTQIITPGSTTNWYITFIDEYPYGNYLNYSSVNWTVSLLYTGGVYTYANNTSSSLSLTAPSLPTGYDWIRDKNNRIQGYLTVTGVDNHSNNYKKVIDIGVDAAPSIPFFNLVTIVDSLVDPTACNRAVVSYYSLGATSYNLYSKINSSSWSCILTNTTATNHFFTSLNEYANFQFKVEAVNSLGTTTSATIYRPRCKTGLNISPNPFSSMLHIDASQAQIQISTVDFIDVQNPSHSYHYAYSGNEMMVDIDASSIASGTYTVTVADEVDYQVSQVVVKP